MIPFVKNKMMFPTNCRQSPKSMLTESLEPLDQSLFINNDEKSK